MSTSHADDHRRTVRSSTKIRHSKEDALDEREFELLLEGANSLQDPFGKQAAFATLVTGRLGLRAGELAHMRDGWINWRRRMIEIPRYQTCRKGMDGGICGQCAQQARQQASTDESRNLDEIKREFWRAKTDDAARAVPFDFDPRTEIALERFFDRWNCWPRSQGAIGRRLKAAAGAATDLDPTKVYPHALRATAATFHAGRGLDVLPLMGLMGWANPSTAKDYVKQSPENTARALHQIHSR